MKHFLTGLASAFSSAAFCQEIVFTSAQTFSKEDMNSFYSSVTVSNDWVLFNANDYKLYAYRKDGTLAWQAYIRRKSNIPPFIVQNTVWVNGNDDNHTHVKIFSLADGSLKKETDFEIRTTPMIRNGVLYSTGISNGGCVFAYDLKTDSLIWERFIAHGCSQNPYYPPEKIIANAEGDNWIELNYQGHLIDPKCEDSTISFPSELKCVKTFDVLTHDGLPVSGKQAERWLANEAITGHSTNHTFFLQNDKLIILGKKLREKSTIDLSSWFENKDFNEYAKKSIIHADDEKLSILLNDHFITYNYQQKKIEAMIDLTQWEPHQIASDNGKIWFISAKDGLLRAKRLKEVNEE